jgi:spermidine/putrescine transport system substrate-binding protein
MSKPDRNRKGIVSRREALKGGAAAMSAAIGVPLTNDAAAAADTLEVVMVNALLNQPLRGFLEKAADAKLSDVPWKNTTDVVSRLMAPGGTANYDFMAPGIDFAAPPVMGRKAGDEKALALDTSLIPNLNQVADLFAPEIVRRDGKVYMVPVTWGYDAPIYNRDKVPESDPYTQSWSLIFEDKYAGKIAWIDAGHQMFIAAGLYMGIADPVKMEKKQIEEVAQFLIAKKKNVRTIYSTGAEAVNLLSSGECVCSYGYIPVRAELQQKGFNVTNSWPKEGITTLKHAAFIPKDSKHAKNAHAIINTMLGADYAGQVTKACGYLSCSKFGPAALSPEEQKRWGYSVLDGSVKSYSQGLPLNISAIIEAWTRVKAV